jgi:transposase
MTDILGKLRERELRIVSMRRSGMTYPQIAEDFDVSSNRVHQLAKEAIRKIAHPARGGGGFDVAHSWVNCRKHGSEPKGYYPKYSNAASYEQVKALHKWQESARDVETACREMESSGIGYIIDDLNEFKISNEWRRKNGAA